MLSGAPMEYSCSRAQENRGPEQHLLTASYSPFQFPMNDCDSLPPMAKTPCRSQSIFSSTSSSTATSLRTPDGTCIQRFKHLRDSLPQELEEVDSAPISSNLILPFNDLATQLIDEHNPAVMASQRYTLPSYYQLDYRVDTACDAHDPNLHPIEVPSNHLALHGVPCSSILMQGYASDPAAPMISSSSANMHAVGTHHSQGAIKGWTPREPFRDLTSTHLNHSVDPQVLQPDNSSAPALNCSLEPDSPNAASDELRSPAYTNGPWYRGDAKWIQEVECHQRAKIARYAAYPLEWKKSDTIPKPLSQINEPCKPTFEKLLEIEGARPDKSEEEAIAALMKKSEEDLTSSGERKSKAAVAGRPRRPMNSAFCFMFWRRSQWGQMFPGMSTGQISGWLSAEWSALKTLKHEEYKWWTDLARKYADTFNKTYEDYKYTRAPNGQGRGGRSKARKLAREGLAPYPLATDVRQNARRAGKKLDAQLGSHNLDRPLQLHYPNDERSFQTFHEDNLSPFSTDYANMPHTSLSYPSWNKIDTEHLPTYPQGPIQSVHEGYTSYQPIFTATPPYDMHSISDYYAAGHVPLYPSYADGNPVLTSPLGADAYVPALQAVPRSLRQRYLLENASGVAENSGHETQSTSVGSDERYPA